MAEAGLTEVVLVEIAGGTFAFPAASVQELVPLVAPTPMPQWPEHAWGLVDLHGVLVPLLDVAPLLGREPTVPKVSHAMLVLTVAERPWAILVERMESVISAQVREPTEEGLSSKRKLIVGLALRTEGPVPLVDPEVLTTGWTLPRYDGRDTARRATSRADGGLGGPGGAP